MPRLAVVAAVAFGVSGAAAAIGASAGSPSGGHPAPPASAERQAVAAADRRPIPGQLKRELQVLRGPSARTPDTAIPLTERASLAEDIHGLNVSDAVWVALPGGRGTWVVPGTNGVCLLDQQLTQACHTLTGPGSPASGGFAAIDGPPVPPKAPSVPPAGRYTLTGLVPDGNTSVLLRLGDGTTATAQVTDNVYWIQVGAPPTSVRAKSSNGQRVTWPLLK